MLCSGKGKAMRLRPKPHLWCKLASFVKLPLVNGTVISLSFLLVGLALFFRTDAAAAAEKSQFRSRRGKKGKREKERILRIRALLLLLQRHTKNF